MPVLSNQKHEKFVRGIFEGLNGSAAYAAAGFKASGLGLAVNASRLLKKADIQARLAELHAERDEIARLSIEKAAEALSIDRQWVMATLKENVDRAMQIVEVRDSEGRVTSVKYDGAVANRALELLGKELGMFVDRKEIRTGALDGLPADTLAAAREQLIAERDRRANRGVFEGDSGKPH